MQWLRMKRQQSQFLRVCSLLVLNRCVECADPQSISNEVGPLVSLTQFRQQHRFTISGKLCAAAFVHDYQTYTDCTDTVSPDGTSGREWCYVVEQLQENASAAPGQKQVPNWGYCAPVIDYNLVRAKANEAFIAKLSEAEKITARLDAEKAKLEDILRRYKETCGPSQEALSARLGRVESLIQKAGVCLNKITEAQKQTVKLRQKASALKDKLNRDRSAALSAPENCATVRGYEDDPYPDGLRGMYFSNPVFFGDPVVTRVDDSIDFRWNSRDPADGVPHQSFSVRWEGFLKAPYTGDFIFFIESTCGARLFLNDQLIAVDRMPSAPDTSRNLGGVPGPVPLLPPSPVDGTQKAKSPSIQLRGGDMNFIRLEMVHSSHLRWSNPDEAMVRLLWQPAGGGAPVSIPPDRFYQSNRRPALKISRVNPHHFEVTFLHDGEFAYKGSNHHFFADVPMKFEGAKTVRSEISPTAQEFVFEVNIPAIVHFAVPLDAIKTGVPLAPCSGTLVAEQAGTDILAVYESENRETPARQARYFKIYNLEVSRTFHPITMTLLRPGMPFAAFFTPQRTNFEGGCGGATIPVTKPSLGLLQVCEASSRKSAEHYDCTHAFSGNLIDRPYSMWHSSSGNGVGEYLIARFREPVHITGFRVKLPDAPTMWPAELALSLSEGANAADQDRQLFTILHAGNLDDLVYSLDPPQITRFARITVTQMYAFGDDVGMAIDLLGTKCSGQQSSHSTSPGPPSEYSQSLNFHQTDETILVSIKSCGETLEGIDEAKPLFLDKEIQVVCPSRCSESTQVNGSRNSSTTIGTQLPKPRSTATVFGEGLYSVDSAVCLAAAHSGACQLQKDRDCVVQIVVQRGANEYPGTMAHGVLSESHGPADLSFVVHAAPLPDLPPQNFEKVSFRVIFGGKNMGQVQQDNGASAAVSAASPAFTYGWSEPAAALEDTCAESESTGSGVQFPLSPKSEHCKIVGAAATSICGWNQWRIRLPHSGVYSLEVQVGVPCGGSSAPDNAYKHFIQANGVSMVTGVELQPKKSYWAVENVFVGPDKLLEITADCTDDVCDNARTTLLSVTIMSDGGTSARTGSGIGGMNFEKILA